jgi:hypothetical protein
LIVINPISINAVEQLKNPVANDQYIPTNTNSTVKITLTGNEIKNSPLKFSIVRSPLHVKLSGTVPNLNYTPYPNSRRGIDTFTFKVNNSTADSDNATVLIDVKPVAHTSLEYANVILGFFDFFYLFSYASSLIIMISH